MAASCKFFPGNEKVIHFTEQFQNFNIVTKCGIRNFLTSCSIVVGVNTIEDPFLNKPAYRLQKDIRFQGHNLPDRHCFDFVRDVLNQQAINFKVPEVDEERQNFGSDNDGIGCKAKEDIGYSSNILLHP
ncbi:MAG: hypothetical protein ACRD8W_21870 [Nitrososphaeraceae archaeon]